MRPLLPVLMLLVACNPQATAGSAPAPRQPSSDVAPIIALRERVRALIAARPGADVAVWFQDFATGDTLGIQADVPFHAASTMKVPVMIELFRRADDRRLSLDQTMTLTNQFRSIVDGSPYSLTASDDSDTLLYTRVAKPISYRELNEHMITQSSNLATNVLIDLLGAERVNATSTALGAPGMRVLRGVEDLKAFDKGLNNTTTARALGTLLDAIEHGRAASRASCDAMREVLLRQTERGEIPAGLPPGTRIAHKTGWITATTHDAAIIYPDGRAPFVLVVLTRAIPGRTDAQRLMADISRTVWETAIASR